MPELPEYKLFAKWLSQRLEGVEFDVLFKCRDYSTKSPDQADVVARFNEKGHKTLTSVIARGKEIGFVFNDGSFLTVHLSLGGFFCVEPLSALHKYPFNEHVNFVLRAKNLDSCLFMVETAQTPNFISITYRETIDWDPARSPDLVSESLDWHARMKEEIKLNPKKFNATLFDLMHDQSLFNGLGSYTINEICERLFLHHGINPATNALEFLRSEQNLKVLRIFAAEFIRQVEEFVGDYNIDCSKYDQQSWLNFSNLLLLVFRKEKCKEKKVFCYNAKSSHKCYSTCDLLKSGEIQAALHVDPREEEIYQKQTILEQIGWTLGKPTRMTENSLNVGMFHWHSGTARVKLYAQDPTSVSVRTTVAKQNLNGQLKRKDGTDTNESPKKKAKKAVYTGHCFKGIETSWQPDVHKVIDENTGPKPCTLPIDNLDCIQFVASPTRAEPIPVNSDSNHFTELSLSSNSVDDIASMDPTDGVDDKRTTGSTKPNKLKRLRKRFYLKFSKLSNKFPVRVPGVELNSNSKDAGTDPYETKSCAKSE